MINFLIGAIIGSMAGIGYMCMIWVNPRDDWKDRK